MNFLNKLFILILLLASCMPGEDPVDPYPRGDTQEVMINAGQYKNLVNFYSLDDQTLVHTADPLEWDVFVANEKMMINVFRYLHTAIYEGDLLSKTDTVGLTFSHMQADSAMWELLPDVNYVVDLGKTNSFQHLGYQKMRYTRNGNTFEVQHAALDQEQWSSIALQENDYLNLRAGQLVDLPAFGTYDLLLGKYTHYFEVEKTDYEVYGALSLNAEVAISTLPYASIETSTLDSLSWSSKYDAIGYDWKSYNLTKGAYEIDEDKVYVIRTAGGFVYKLRFTNFYDGTGTSGHPTFEFELI